jgi:hypothetical protein
MAMLSCVLFALAAPLLHAAPLQGPVQPVAAVEQAGEGGFGHGMRSLLEGMLDDFAPRASGDGFTGCREGGLCELSGCR